LKLIITFYIAQIDNTLTLQVFTKQLYNIVDMGF